MRYIPAIPHKWPIIGKSFKINPCVGCGGAEPPGSCRDVRTSQHCVLVLVTSAVAGMMWHFLILVAIGYFLVLVASTVS